MFAIPGIVVLIAFIYTRAQELIEPLRAIPLLYIFFALVLVGMVLDWRFGNVKLAATPQLPFVLGFFGWCILTALVRTPRQIHVYALELLVPLVLYLVIAHGVQSFRGLHAVGGSVLALTLFVCAVGVHQGFSHTGCVLIDETLVHDHTIGKYDGRHCETTRECYLGDVEPGGEYLCERIGLFGLHSVSHGRVRYSGVLNDPNELALAAGMGLPLAFAWGWRRSRLAAWSMALIALALFLVCTVLTQSRSGQLVILAVLAVYFVRRYGMKGIIAGGVLGLPVALLGGRHSVEASLSTVERIDCWYEALGLFRSHPIFGVGFKQFGEYHYLTAHNSLLLTASELGIVGMLLFVTVFYLSVKIPFAVYVRYRSDTGSETRVARVWALALIASFAGLGVGIFFLSFAYHPLLWIFTGLSAAFYLTVKRHDPDFKVVFGWRDFVLVTAGSAALVGLLFFYTRWAVS